MCNIIGGRVGGVGYKNMDNNQTWEIKSRRAEQMQNWKKQILMDPILNGLYDSTTSGEEFFNSKISSLPHHQIASLFSTLSSINFQLLHNLQKQVEAKSTLIEKSYNQLLAYKSELEDNTQTKPTDTPSLEHLNYLKFFNKKYENVENSIVLWKNISDCLHFFKAFQNFKVSTNILKTRLRGYDGNQETINPFTIAKTLKQIIQLSTDFDFSGIKGFENERGFVSNTKTIIHAIGCKTLPKLLLQCVSLADQEKASSEKIEKNIEQWINALNNIGTLREFVINYGKSLMRDISENIKKNMKGDQVSQGYNTQKILFPYLQESCKAIILLEQKLIIARKVELSNIPNLFVCVWEKLCSSLKQSITSLKNQQTRTVPKSREQSIIWKYPTLYAGLAKLCSNVQIFLIESALFNNYNFGKNKQKLMINCLLELSVQYHHEKDKCFSEIFKIFNKKSANGEVKVQIYQQSKEEKEELEINKNVKHYLNQAQLLFKDCKCYVIYNSLVNCLCEKLQSFRQELREASGIGDIRENQQEGKKKQFSAKILNKLQNQIKNMLKKYGQCYGVDKFQLQSFKVQ